MKQIDFYYLHYSTLHNRIATIFSSEKNFALTCIEQKEFERTQVNPGGSIVFIEEEDSFLNTYTLLEQIFSRYSKKPTVIIITGNKDIYNVVQWMRAGAADCLWIGDISPITIRNSIQGSESYITHINDGAFFTPPSDRPQKNTTPPPIQIPRDPIWNSLEDNKEYPMTLLMPSITFESGAIGRYSQSSMQKIYQLFKQEFHTAAQQFGGKLWYWNNTSGILVFHFGDHINCGVVSAISLFNKFFLICFEKLKLDEVLSFSIAIHQGNGVYNSKDTGHITSDLINSITHLAMQYTKKNTLNITEDIYNKLSPRISPSFSDNGSFENRKIYQYNFP